MSLRIAGDTGGVPLRPAESTATPAPATPTSAGATEGPDFATMFEAQIADAARLHATAAQKTEALSKGLSDDLHGTMISVKEAEISMKLVGAVRNKLLDAFHELWRINL
jgi:flagellar hook-basal body complex protein FliE